MASTDLKNIFVFIVAYRDKRFIDTVKDAIHKADSPERIFWRILVQDSNHRKIDEDVKNLLIEYKHWDDITGFAKHRFNLMNNSKNANYLLCIQPGSAFSEHWDTNLISFAADKDKFFLTDSDTVSPDNMFLNKETIEYTKYPSYLKYWGESEEISIRAYCKGVPVINGLSSYIIKPEPREYDYIPFSKSHRYRDLERLYKYGYNDYVDLRMSGDKYFEYAKLHPLRQIHHVLDDVSYSEKDIMNPKVGSFTIKDE